MNSVVGAPVSYLSSRRIGSRWPSEYATVVGTLRGSVVRALVWRDGRVNGDALLLDEARRLCRDAARRPGRSIDPLEQTLRLARACDAVLSVVLRAAGWRPTVHPPVAAVAQIVDPEWFSVDADDQGDAHVVAFHGELDIAGCEVAERGLVETDRSQVVLDLQHLSLLDASGLRTILGAKRRIEAQGRALRIKGAHGLVRRIFEVTGLGHLLTG